MPTRYLARFLPASLRPPATIGELVDAHMHRYWGLKRYGATAELSRDGDGAWFLHLNRRDGGSLTVRCDLYASRRLIASTPTLGTDDRVVTAIYPSSFGATAPLAKGSYTARWYAIVNPDLGFSRVAKIRFEVDDG